ncbi:MAG TPA: phenylalanine--tRNA ligase subunit alpha [Bacteroidota bacterium]|nr:phenylalanine--tRNA ligase subunit alpha [Bacteroidota bacterium]
MQPLVDQLLAQAESDILSVRDQQSLDAFRVRYLSRKGQIAGLFEQLKNLSPEERPVLGKSLNALRARVQAAFDKKAQELSSTSAGANAIDLTLPGRMPFVGSRHPLTQTLDEIRRIFTGMGFSIADGPELEDDYHNFGALNFPPDHPARDMQDTFFVSRNALLRTHTSPVQIRVMENQPPPVRAIMPGKVYRNEAINARSYCMFHQVEGLCVDRGVTFSELKGTLISFIQQFYGSGLKYRFRPTFFPFTEPSADIYITCFICNGKGCRMCKQLGWLEILGCGMVHPNVFRSVGYDPEKYTGYAFGMGIERIAILRYGIDDIRLFFENDVRFLAQF